MVWIIKYVQELATYRPRVQTGGKIAAPPIWFLHAPVDGRAGVAIPRVTGLAAAGDIYTGLGAARVLVAASVIVATEIGGWGDGQGLRLGPLPTR